MKETYSSTLSGFYEVDGATTKASAHYAGAGHFFFFPWQGIRGSPVRGSLLHRVCSALLGWHTSVRRIFAGPPFLSSVVASCTRCISGDHVVTAVVYLGRKLCAYFVEHIHICIAQGFHGRGDLPGYTLPLPHTVACVHYIRRKRARYGVPWNCTALFCNRGS